VRQPRAAPANPVLALQRAAGNQAVASFLRIQLKKKKKAKTCPVAALTAITDADAQTIEGGTRVVWNNTAQGLQQAAEDLVQLITDAGGTAAINSAYRPKAYQDHLYEVWTKAKQLKKHPETVCDTVRDEVDAEMTNHSLSTGRLVGKTSNHTAGRAVDIEWTLPGGLTRALCHMPAPRKGKRATTPSQEQCIDALATAAGMTHRLHTADRPHFELL
jgi:D-alanyl-D-alanine dipeptidase